MIAFIKFIPKEKYGVLLLHDVWAKHKFEHQGGHHGFWMGSVATFTMET
jgi:hypothetical protein